MNTTLKSFHETNVGELFSFYRYPSAVFQKAGYAVAQDTTTGAEIEFMQSNSISVQA